MATPSMLAIDEAKDLVQQLSARDRRLDPCIVVGDLIQGVENQADCLLLNRVVDDLFRRPLRARRNGLTMHPPVPVGH